MTYANKTDVKEEFKSVDLNNNTSISPAQVVRFLQETDSLINSYLANKYTLPISGTASVKQGDTVNVDAVVDNTLYTVTINGLDASYTSGIGATALQIRDGLKAAINQLFEAVTASDGSTNSEIVLKSQVAGEGFGVSVGANLSTTPVTLNVKGDERLDILRTIEVNIVACRIAKILKLKVNNDEFTKQESTHCQAAGESMKYLKDLSTGKILLPGAGLISSGGGFGDYNYTNSVEPVMNKDINQW